MKKALKFIQSFFYLNRKPLAAHHGCISITHLPAFTIGFALARLSAICIFGTLYIVIPLISPSSPKGPDYISKSLFFIISILYMDVYLTESCSILYYLLLLCPTTVVSQTFHRQNLILSQQLSTHHFHQRINLLQ